MIVTRDGVDRSTNYTPEELTAFSIVKVGWDGEVGQGTAPLPDPAGNQEPYEGEQLLLEQDGQTIIDGFLGAVATERGIGATGTRRVHTMTLADDNALLAGHATPSWTRPAEAPAARWAAFVAAFLPSGIDTTWLLATHESGITLPKTTYRTDSLFDDLSADTIRPTGKTVYIENRNFHWHLPTEGQTCSIVIHDTNAETTTSFQPRTASRSKDGMDLRNKIYARNDKGVVVSTSDATSISRHNGAGLVHQGYSEYGEDTAADMARDIAVTLAERKDERVTWTYKIGPLTAAEVVELIPGSQMTVTVAGHGLSAAVKRIARVTLEYRHGARTGRFMATVELGFPVRKRRKPTKTSSATPSGGGSGVDPGTSNGPSCCPDPACTSMRFMGGPGHTLTTGSVATDTGQYIGYSEEGIAWDVTMHLNDTAASLIVSTPNLTWRSQLGINTNGRDRYIYARLPKNAPNNVIDERRLRFTLVQKPGTTDVTLGLLFDPLGFGFGWLLGGFGGAPFVMMNPHAGAVLNPSQIGFSASAGAFNSIGTPTAIPSTYWVAGTTYTMDVVCVRDTPVVGQTTATVTISDGSTSYSASTISADGAGLGDWARENITSPGILLDTSLSLNSATPWIVDILDVNVGELQVCATTSPYKSSVRTATDAAGTLATDYAAGKTVGGVIVNAGDRILIKNQADQTENGVYTVNASGAPTRAPDSADGMSLQTASVPIAEGTSAGTTFVQQTSKPIVGVSDIVFTPLSETGSADVLTSDDSLFETSVGGWTSSSGTVTWDNTKAFLGLLGSLKWVSPTTATDYVSTPVSGTFLAGHEYHAVVALMAEEALSFKTFDLSLGLIGTDSVTVQQFARTGPDIISSEHWVLFLLRWTPSATRTGVTLRVARTNATGTQTVHVGYARVVDKGGGLGLTVFSDTRLNDGGHPYLYLHTPLEASGAFTLTPADALGNKGPGIVFGGGGVSFRADDGNSSIGVGNGAAIQAIGTPGDLSFEGLFIEVGNDQLDLYVGEKDASTIQMYADGYDIELVDNGTNWRSIAAGGIVRDLASMESRKGSGTATIASGTTSIAVTHGAGYTPGASDIIVTPTNNPANDPGNIWISAIGATTFTINCRANPGVGGATFAWRVDR